MKKITLLSIFIASTVANIAYSNITYALYDSKSHIVEGKYSITYNKSGAVLKSEKEILHLRKDCAVSSSLYGKGYWWWANGGWGIDFNSGKKLVSAARMDAPDIDDVGKCNK